MKVKPGQRWKFGLNTYHVEAVHGDKCTIVNESTKEKNSNYDLANLKKDTWTLLLQERDCPECGQTKPMADNDFICEDCRAAMPISCKMVVHHNGDEVIAKLDGKPEKLTLIVGPNDEIVELVRENIPERALEALKEFLNHSD